MIQIFHHVLSRDLPKWIALGWHDDGDRVWIMSVGDYSVTIEWRGECEPNIPAANNTKTTASDAQ